MPRRWPPAARFRTGLITCRSPLAPVGLGGAVHIAAPMNFSAAYAAPEAKSYKQALSVPVFVVGRINQPQSRNWVVARGEPITWHDAGADHKPQMPIKAEPDALTVSRLYWLQSSLCPPFPSRVSVSCISTESRREKTVFATSATTTKRRVMVVSGGPAGR